MIVVYPRSDESRLTLLTQINSEANSELGAGVEHLPASLLAAVQRAKTEWQDFFRRKKVLFDQRSAEMVQRDEVLRILEATLVAGRSTVLSEATIHSRPLSYIKIYDADMPLPQYISAAELLTKVRSFVDADAQAVIDGYPTLPYPTMSDFENRFRDARREHAEANYVDRRLDDLQHEMVAKRNEVDELIRLVSAQISLRWFSLPADDVRHIKERFGYTFESDATDTSGSDDGLADDSSASTASA